MKSQKTNKAASCKLELGKLEKLNGYNLIIREQEGSVWLLVGSGLFVTVKLNKQADASLKIQKRRLTIALPKNISTQAISAGELINLNSKLGKSVSLLQRKTPGLVRPNYFFRTNHGADIGYKSADTAYLVSLSKNKLSVRSNQYSTSVNNIQLELPQFGSDYLRYLNWSLNYLGMGYIRAKPAIFAEFIKYAEPYLDTKSISYFRRIGRIEYRRLKSNLVTTDPSKANMANWIKLAAYVGWWQSNPVLSKILKLNNLPVIASELAWHDSILAKPPGIRDLESAAYALVPPIGGI